MMGQVFAATAYMHANSICHRDLKPGNVLFLTTVCIADNNLKVCDFGLACAFTEGQDIRDACGTVYYMSPQALEGRYTCVTDLWSCGVIMYLLLCGYPPFTSPTGVGTGLEQAIKRGNYSFKDSHWEGISDEAKALIRCLLTYAQTERITAESAVCHEWLAPNALCLKSAQLDQVARRAQRFLSDDKVAPPKR